MEGAVDLEDKMEQIQPNMHDLMNAVASALDQGFRPHGFALLVFPFGEDTTRVSYISNANHDDMLTAMKAFIAKHEDPAPDMPTAKE
jgi:hypothetical protein